MWWKNRVPPPHADQMSEKAKCNCSLSPSFHPSGCCPTRRRRTRKSFRKFASWYPSSTSGQHEKKSRCSHLSRSLTSPSFLDNVWFSGRCAVGWNVKTMTNMPFTTFVLLVFVTDLRLRLVVFPCLDDCQLQLSYEALRVDLHSGKNE